MFDSIMIKAKKRFLIFLYSIFSFFRRPFFEIYVIINDKSNIRNFENIRNYQSLKSDTPIKPYYVKGIPKKIWVFWEQGPDEAPYLVKKCLNSWKRKNPDWEVLLISAKNISYYLEEINIPSYLPIRYKADLLRLRLLKKYGGVWADATTLCHRPLNEWLPLQFSGGLFMFSNPSEDRLIENWFIASTPQHPLIVKWESVLSSYCMSLKMTHSAYFVAFYVYQWMILTDSQMRVLHRQCSSLNAVPCFFMQSVLFGSTDIIQLKLLIFNGLPLSKLNWKSLNNRDDLDQVISEIE